MNKRKLAIRVANKENISIPEAKMLLSSRWQEYKSFGIKAVYQQRMITLEKDIEILTKDKDCVIASDAIECMLELNPDKALKIARKYLDDKRRFVQASSLYVIAELSQKELYNDVKKISEKYKKNYWRYLSFLETLYLLDNTNDFYQTKIIEILNKTKSYQTQCAAINILNNIINSANKNYIINELHNFKNRKNLPLSVQSTLDRVLNAG